MSYNSALQMYVLNDTGGNAVFSFSHMYSDDQPCIYQASVEVPPGGLAGPLNVGFNTGFGHFGDDYWYCQAVVKDGPNPGTYRTEGSLQQPTKACQASTQDDGMIYHFPFSTTAFVIPLLSGPAAASVSS